MKKMFLVFIVAALFAAMAVAAQASETKTGETKVGGHLKLNLYDYVDGTHTTTLGSNNNTQNCGFLGLAELILYVSQEINDKLSVDVQPTF
jgi:ABC-type oligopeptide transport system substrate-binding subunit